MRMLDAIKKCGYSLPDNPDSIIFLNLTVYTNNRLAYAGIKTITELKTKTDDELLSISYFGKKCLKEVREALNED